MALPQSRLGAIAPTMHTPASSDQLPERFDRASTAIEALRTQWRTIMHVGTHERIALGQLQFHGSMPMSELAARIALSRAAVTSLVDRLEAEQWVERTHDARDRRRTVVRLTAQATTALEAITRDFHDDLERWTTSLSSDERVLLAQLLDRVTSIAEQHANALRETAAERALAEQDADIG